MEIGYFRRAIQELSNGDALAADALSVTIACCMADGKELVGRPRLIAQPAAGVLVALECDGKLTIIDLDKVVAIRMALAADGADAVHAAHRS